MAGRSKPIFVGAWLLGAVGVVSLAQAKSGQAWSDPPPDLNAGPLTTDSGSGGSQLRQAQDWPDEAARRRPSTEVARPSGTPDVNETGSIQTAGGKAANAEAARASAARQLRIKQAAARKAREKQVALAQAEAARKEREKQIALAETEAARKQREKQAERARQEQKARVAARARMVAAAAREQRKIAAQQVAEAQPNQAPQPADYEVMRLRTLLFPDGRTVQVLTRPEQETVDLPLR